MHSEVTEARISEIAEKLYPNISQIIKLKILNKCSNSYSDIRLDDKIKPTIYIGTLNRSDNAITGAIAHEIAHILLRELDFHKKLYFKLFRKLTKSNQKAIKYSYKVALLTGCVYEHETKADQLGLEFLTSAGFNQECMMEMLQGLKSKSLLQYILKRKRLSAIRKIIKHRLDKNRN